MQAMNGPVGYTAGVVIPAHNEAKTIGRLLAALESHERRFRTVVVCNGCTDDTARRASEFRGVDVVEIAQPSKREAMHRGDEMNDAMPRVYIDADVEIDGASVSALIDRLESGQAIAVAPARTIPRSGVRWPVRWYYDVWEWLPQVRTGLFGRGVIGLSAVGNERVRALPPMMSDDLVMSEAFTEDERSIVESAHVIVRPPKTLRDLLRRRIRVATGNVQAEKAEARGESSKTSLVVLIRLGRQHPRLAPRIVVFLVITVVARLLSVRAVRSGDFSTWKRDESSRE